MKKNRSNSLSEFEYDLRCPKIDVHWHVGSWNMNEDRLGIREMSEDFDKFGYRYALVSSITAILYDMEIGNFETAKFIEQERRCRGLVVINPRREDISLKEIEKYMGQRKGFIGLKTAADYYNTTIKDTGYRRILKIANGHGWTILTHKQDLEFIAGEYVNTTFITAHSMISDVKKLSEFSNVYFDIAASYAHREETNIEGMIELAGAERILFGTDAQVISPAWSIGKVSSAKISQLDKNKIFYENAFNLFNQFKDNHFNH